MNNSLSELKDIHIPDTVNFWPPAYGWWLVAFSTLVLLSLIVVLLIKRHMRGRAKRQAKQEIRALSFESGAWRLGLNSIVKRVLMSYYPTLPVQQLYGEHLSQLISLTLPTSKQALFKQQMSEFQQRLYQVGADSEADYEKDKRLVLAWINSAKLSNRKVALNLSRWSEQHIHQRQGASHV